MSPRLLCAVTIAVLFAVSVPAFAAVSVVVGPATCMPNRTHYTTIQSAVDNSAAGTNVLVCPGTYPEQVIIAKPLNLTGITDGTGDAAVISVPAGGLVANGTISTLGAVAVQLLVENTELVTIGNMVVDGSGAGCVTGAARVFGVEFSNVGSPSDGVTGGRISNSVVRNELDTCTLTDGIETDQSYVTISNNEVHDVDITPIGTHGGEASVTNNSVQNALNGIVVADCALGTTITNNTVSNLGPSVGFTLSIGLWLDTCSASITKNTVASVSLGGYGLYLNNTTAGTNVNGNKVSYAELGVYLLGSTASSLVQSNTFSDVFYGVVDFSTGGANNVTKNTVNEASYGVYDAGISTTDVLTPNTFYNVVVTVDPNQFNDSGTSSME